MLVSVRTGASRTVKSLCSARRVSGVGTGESGASSKVSPVSPCVVTEARDRAAPAAGPEMRTLLRMSEEEPTPPFMAWPSGFSTTAVTVTAAPVEMVILPLESTWLSGSTFTCTSPTSRVAVQYSR